MPDPFFTRRKFLRTVILGGAIAPTVPSFVNRTFAALDGVAGQRALLRRQSEHPRAQLRGRDGALHLERAAIQGELDEPPRQLVVDTIPHDRGDLLVDVATTAPHALA